MTSYHFLHSSLLLLLSLFVVSSVGQNHPRPLQTHSRLHRPIKSVVNYLGTNFLLADGCPEPGCDKAQVIRH